MEEKSLNALRWIVGIFDKHNIPYRIGGGFAARAYGSSRPLNDIDISLSGQYFPILLPDVSEYVTSGPQYYLNAKWDCDTLCLSYHGQDIDITDVDTLKMSNKEKVKWIVVKDTYRKFNPMMTDIDGIKVSLLDPRDLVAYKKELDGDHQLVDIQAVESYIKGKGL